MSDSSAYNLTGKIEILQNDALEIVYIYQLEEIIGHFDLSAIWSESICTVFWG